MKCAVLARPAETQNRFNYWQIVAKWGNAGGTGVADCDTVRIIITTYCTNVLLINPVYTTRPRARLLLTEALNIVH